VSHEKTKTVPPFCWRNSDPPPLRKPLPPRPPEEIARIDAIYASIRAAGRQYPTDAEAVAMGFFIDRTETDLIEWEGPNTPDGSEARPFPPKK
jgi:hypothetical protein